MNDEGRFDGLPDKARDEFFSEAQELVDVLGKELLALDRALTSGASADPEQIQNAFRHIHTLKGISGVFGIATMSGLSHELETVLNDLRLGRIELTTDLLDVLFDAVSAYTHILAAIREETDEPRDEVESVLAAIADLGGRGPSPRTVVAEYEIDAEVLGVLTEYEEHRLRENVEKGCRLFWMTGGFSLATIDTSLQALKDRVRPFGEIITYLPTGDGGSADSLGLQILVAIEPGGEEPDSIAAESTLTLTEVRRRAATPVPPRRGGFLNLPGMATLAPTSFANHEPVRIVDRQPESEIPPKMVAENESLSVRSVAQTVRVDIRKLDRLLDRIGELSLLRGGIGRLLERLRADGTARAHLSELGQIHRSFERAVSTIQKSVLEARMVALTQLFDKVARAVRQVGRELDKSVQLVATGGDTELDKLLVEELSDPLLHIIRNAIDHGLESPGEREQLGKPAVGTIALNAYPKGNHVIIEIEDDGRGIDVDVIRRRALDLGILSADELEGLSADDAISIVFRPGFTTRPHASELSGRGMGMDIVKTRIARLGGVVEITSDLQIGTKVTITLPITLALIGVLTVKVGLERYCVPLSAVEEVFSLDTRGIRIIEGREFLLHRGMTLPLVRLGVLFDTTAEEPGQTFVVVGQLGMRRLGFVVDALFGQEEVVVKALGPSLQHARDFAGAADIGESGLVLVLDVPSLMEEYFAIDIRANAPRLSEGALS